MHVPAATGVAIEPATVHTAGVLEVNDTASPEVEDADRVTGSPTATGDGWAKAMVCAFFPTGFTWKERRTSGAAA